MGKDSPVGLIARKAERCGCCHMAGAAKGKSRGCGREGTGKPRPAGCGASPMM